MGIRIHAEKTSGATDSDKKALRDTVRRITDRINYDCSEIVWIIYHPDSCEERDKGNHNQAAVHAAIADMDDKWGDIRRRCRVIDFRSLLRPEYGYCYIEDKRIYISVSAIRLRAASVFVGGTGNALQNILSKLPNLSGVSLEINGMRERGEPGSGRCNEPDSLQEVVLHELAHIVSGRDDGNAEFWKTLVRLRNKM